MIKFVTHKILTNNRINLKKQRRKKRPMNHLVAIHPTSYPANQPDSMPIRHQPWFMRYNWSYIQRSINPCSKPEVSDQAFLTALQLVFNPFSQFVPQLELFSQLQLSLWSDPITFSVPRSTWWVQVKIQGDGNLAETQMKKWWKFEHFLTSRIKWKVTLKTLNGYFR